MTELGDEYLSCRRSVLTLLGAAVRDILIGVVGEVPRGDKIRGRVEKLIHDLRVLRMKGFPYILLRPRSFGRVVVVLEARNRRQEKGHFERGTRLTH